MNSFVDVLKQLQSIINTDQPLQLYIAENFDRPLTVKISYSDREEINLTELPLALITRPRLNKTSSNMARDSINTIRIYLGFNQSDKVRGMEQLIELEELFDDLFMNNYSLGGLVTSALPTESANDEGAYHPSYFVVMDISVQHRRN